MLICCENTPPLWFFQRLLERNVASGQIEKNIRNAAYCKRKVRNSVRIVAAKKIIIYLMVDMAR